jgi:hypothetical protein
VISFTRVTSLLTRTSWQLRQPIAMAEWTALPFDLSSWHSRHFAESTLRIEWNGVNGGGGAREEQRDHRK